MESAMSSRHMLNVLLLSLCYFTLQDFDELSRVAQPRIHATDRIRIAEAFRIAEQIGDSLWSGWSKTPFALLLVTPTHEFLLRHPKPTQDWDKAGYDSLLRCDVYFRKRLLSMNLLATYPAVNGISTVVVGQPENTQAKTSTHWIVTLLHEHFHQLQEGQADYYDAVNALNLSRGDQTGMWMLNYPFPYDSVAIQQQFKRMTAALHTALRAAGTPALQEQASEFLKERQRFTSLLSSDDHKYFSFQLWKEGIARYTEYHIARLAGKYFTPSSAVSNLPDFIPFATRADTLYNQIISRLNNVDLGKSRRIVFYTVGAAEGLLLDTTNPGWRKEYQRKRFYLEKYYSTE